MLCVYTGRGSDAVPLCWMISLRNANTGKTRT
jgi:hypothetical protein